MRRLRVIALLVVAVLFLAAAVSPAAATGGAYRGKTAQGFHLRVRLDGRRDRIFLVRVKVKLRCRDGGLLYDDLSDFEASRLKADGRFADMQIGPSDEVRWWGRVHGNRVRGSLRVKDKVAGGVRCDSGTVRFGVRRTR
jgi:hypothetical protein